MRRSEVSRSWVLRWERRDFVSILEGREGEDGVFADVADFGVCGKAVRDISRTICVLLTKTSSQGSREMFGGLSCGAEREHPWRVVGGADLGFKGFGSGGGPIGNASSGSIAFLPAHSTLRASSFATGFGSVLGLVPATWRELREWVGGINSVGIF